MTGDGPRLPAPALSVCIPAYDRPRLVRSALRSVLATPVSVTSKIEVVVSDDSTDGRVGEVCNEELQRWSGRSTYRHNASPLGMAGNWNRCIQLATGGHVLILHDDDFLLPGAAGAVISALDAAVPAPAALLFGVTVVDAGGVPRRRQVFGRRRFLPPAPALSRLLGDSSFVRFPGMVVSRSAYRAAPPFDEKHGEVADLFMWVRLAGTHGLQLEPAVTAAYRVHHGALTTGMWRSETVERLRELFDDDLVRRTLGPAERNRQRGRFLSQFLLAGARRRLRADDPVGALDVLGLFRAPAMSGIDLPWWGRAGHWLLATMAFACRFHHEGAA